MRQDEEKATGTCQWNSMWSTYFGSTKMAVLGMAGICLGRTARGVGRLAQRPVHASGKDSQGPGPKAAAHLSIVSH